MTTLAEYKNVVFFQENLESKELQLLDVKALIDDAHEKRQEVKAIIQQLRQNPKLIKKVNFAFTYKSYKAALSLSQKAFDQYIGSLNKGYIKSVKAV
ncbi:MAG: hypothetical protein CMH32_06895 [Micavibrio sp.]|nr:hypothetical protein [Micavibrio sp.]|tara:strand:+ start:757 stop:1047 length:291 start_codon:yes stop_codon:yes gene_type:complete